MWSDELRPMLRMMRDEDQPKLCRLQDEVGRTETCPGGKCPFWEEAGLIGEPGCAFDRIALDVHGRPELAQHLLRIRHALAAARSDEQVGERPSLFYRLRR